MGYYATGEGSIVIPAEKLTDAYNALVELNKHDELKTGGHFGAGVSEGKPANSTSVAKNPNRWFSWMDWNYDEVCSTAGEILEEVGFQTEETPDDGLELFYYDSKSGAEDHFINAIAPFVNEGSTMEWTGEDGEKWRWVFENGEMITEQAVITWER